MSLPVVPLQWKQASVREWGVLWPGYLEMKKAHSIRLDVISNFGIRAKTRSIVFDFYDEQRASGEWSTSAYVTTALAQIHCLSQVSLPEFNSVARTSAVNGSLPGRLD